MRMRKGNGGQDLFGECLRHGIAAIHYGPVEDVDLSQFDEDRLPEEWAVLAPSQRGSLKKLAWQIQGGDTIFVAESYPSRLVGIGRVRGVEGQTAYQYLEETPIQDDDGHPWRHVLLVEWEQDFQPVPYPKPWAAQATVLDLPRAEVEKLLKLAGRKRKPNEVRGAHANQAADDYVGDSIQRRQLEDCAYTRYTAEAIKTIERKHAALCNEFTAWLSQRFLVECQIERRNIDLSFNLGTQRVLVEFKVAYSGDPKPAIREAMGQILEYNLYPGRTTFDHWVLILNCQPTSADREFLGRLHKFGMPLSFGWPSSGSFEFTPECLLHIA